MNLEAKVHTQQTCPAFVAGHDKCDSVLNAHKFDDSAIVGEVCSIGQINRVDCRGGGDVSDAILDGDRRLITRATHQIE
jgi:hypothetical protein